ncbi:hypothetical protein ABRP93_11570, partial [Corynebacterium sp. KPL2850]|uniref:hypothetical protein n=1 Tax=Corynebacterium sp. KPL2850 TaxID=3158318 RepID=UPI0032EAA912
SCVAWWKGTSLPQRDAGFKVSTIWGGQVRQTPVDSQPGIGKYAQAVLGKKKAPQRALFLCVWFSRVRGAVASAELMGRF